MTLPEIKSRYDPIGRIRILERQSGCFWLKTKERKCDPDWGRKTVVLHDF